MATEPGVWRPTAVVITCEHAGNEVPEAYAAWFAGADAVLASHRGWDIGSLGYALRLAARTAAPLIHTTVTRLLIEANRSPHDPGLFSTFSRDRGPAEREEIVRRYYTPHRRAVESTIAALMSGGGRVLHLGAHSFTDVLDGVPREMDIGLLFDPDRPSESSFCRAWISQLEERSPPYRVRSNQPYLGTDDGLTTYLRTVFPADRYAGVEIEVRQGMIDLPQEQRAIGDLLADALPADAGAGAR